MKEITLQQGLHNALAVLTTPRFVASFLEHQTARRRRKTRNALTAFGQLRFANLVKSPRSVDLPKGNNLTHFSAHFFFKMARSKLAKRKRRYIRELADRLQNVEQAIGSQPSPQGLQDYTGNVNMDPNRDHRKRNHSTSEGLSPADSNHNQAQRAQDRYPPPPGWNAQTQALYAPPYASGYHLQTGPPGYTDMNYHAPAPNAVMSSSGTVPAVGPPQMVEQGINTDDMQMSGANELADVTFAWKENLIDE